MTVLVLTQPSDATADLVIAELNRRAVPVVRLDPGDFPESVQVTARIGARHSGWMGELRGQHRDVSLDEVSSVYYRRPSPHRLHPGLSDRDAKWTASEARAGLGGLLTALTARWVNHPHLNTPAGVKPHALAIAARCGLAVPDTLITNDPAAAREFVAGLPGGVAAYKTIGTTGPAGTGGEAVAVWTTQVRADDIDNSVALTAHQFQEWITTAYEVRLTVVGPKMFAAEIHTPTQLADVRTDYAAHTYTPCDAPAPIAAGVRRLIDAFELSYAAMDFLVSPDGTWTLVDLNPNGQWAYIPALRTPITHALADLLEDPA
ncbi:hypothetical protein RVR_10556 [Actinacidiphila reveromycinica]|uniref:MvdD-like pre-ATP grasp domain-containing protein n=1 Tax=Actinacidiphila reveromycinica TaxID=659352 RepID=A0A7U3UXG2_9ACTN|nr:ATP-grasp ribosomal peptide maturase [Streptomyces sp. SN-593]BBB00557.1 hypothetical protein RVR_7683 [Streptomyces sp. SN-593]BBB00610.1 hypothetical protein RVR_10556 [Streptomyces sp. SN-593]